MSFSPGPISTVLLIFGGCCSNVFALEAIVKSEPSSGLLITFFQFIFTTLAAAPSQISWTNNTGSLFEKPKVPLHKWVLIAAMFFSINMLNNWAFAFNISVPVHIILRSFGSVTTMLMGWLRGKRYSKLQVLSVVLLTFGVLLSAWADAAGKGKNMDSGSKASSSDFTMGLVVLLAAQFFSAWSGAYVEDTYAEYKASWTENLFYSHLLSLPLFLPILPGLQQQYAKLSATPPLQLQRNMSGLRANLGSIGIPANLVDLGIAFAENLPRGVLFLLANALTQLACISGVNLLSSKSSAVTVTIVLNIRKLVSFIFSTILFGHRLSGLMILGSALVFGSGALYGYETSWRLPQQRRQREHKVTAMNGHGSKKVD